MRKYILGSIIGLLSVCSFSLADITEFTVNGEYTTVGNFTYGFDNYANVWTDNGTNGGYFAYTERGGNTMGMFAWKNGQLYYYGNGDGAIQQGYISKWCIAEQYTSCIGGNFQRGTDDILQNMGNVQKVYFGNYGGNYPNNPLYICFYDGTNNYCTMCSAMPNIGYGCAGTLTGTSLGILGNKIADIQEYERDNSPLQPNTPSGKPDTEGVCMTIQDMLDRQNETYNTGMCYSNTRYLTSTGRVTNTPKFITELYPTYTELRQDMNLYTNYCTPPADMNYCQQAFLGKEDNYTLIQKIPQTTDLTVLYDFCTTYQTRSGNLQKNVCDMTEEERKNLRPSQMTQEGYAERIAKHPTTTTKPGTGTVYDDLTDEQNRDLLEAIPRVYTKITGIFKARGGYPGIIPNYITWILLLIVLFKLFKK